MTPAKIKWNLDDGYPKVFPPDQTTRPFRVMASGETNGLGVDLFLNTSEHQFACDGSSIGFNVSYDLMESFDLLHLWANSRESEFLLTF